MPWRSGRSPPPQLAQPSSTATLTAKAAELEADTHQVKAQGDVVLKSGDIAVRSDAMEYNTETREGTAAGLVVLTDGNLVLVGREASFSLLGEMQLTVRWADLFQKLPIERPGIDQVRDLESARAFGHNAFVIRAEELTRLGPSHVLARSMRISSCDCGAATPSWSIRAKSADLLMGERALLYWGAFYVKDVPVLPLPALYIPLSERQTGFLMPRPGWANISSSGGFSLDEPFFLTLGRSWDVTLEGGYRFGARETSNPAPDQDVKRMGTKGVRLASDLRYMPSDDTAGRFKVMAVDDRHHDLESVDTGQGNHSRYLPEARGWRGELSERHSTLLGDGSFLRTDINLVSDRNLLFDEPMDAVAGLFQANTRSLAMAQVKAQGALLGAVSTLYQDLNAAQRPGWSSTRVMGQGAAVTEQRPGLVYLDAPPVRLIGPVDVGLEASLARYQPFSLFAGPGPSELVSRTRAEAAPKVSWSPFSNGPIRGEVYGWFRVDASAFDGGGGLAPSSELLARGVAGAYLGTELSRVYGNTWRHTLVPQLEVRALSGRLGTTTDATAGQITGCQVSNNPSLWNSSMAVVPRDEYDLVAIQPCLTNGAPPLTLEDLPQFQGVASLASRLQRRGSSDYIRLEVGQDIDLRHAQAADLYGRLDLRIARASLAAQYRYDWALRRAALVSAQGGLSDARGDSVNIGFDWLLETLTDRLRAGVDDLFGPRAITTPNEALGVQKVLTLGSTTVLFNWLAVNAGATFDLDANEENNAVLQSTGTLGTRSVLNSLSARVILGKTCHECWRLELGGAIAPSRTNLFNAATPQFLLELKNLGTFGN